jgi:hypothetical protein
LFRSTELSSFVGLTDDKQNLAQTAHPLGA